MKRSRALLILAVIFSILVIMPFSIVQGANPVIVRNQATITKPYETGYRNYPNLPGSKADADADYDKVEGRVFAFAFASEISSAWANASLEDDFEIIHSSNYRITFSFNYKGLVMVRNNDFMGDQFNAKVELKVYVIDRSDGHIFQRTETVYELQFLMGDGIIMPLEGSRNLILTPSLVEGHVYEWRAELRTEANASDPTLGDLEVTTDFFNLDYGANITQVRVVDLSPDYIPPTTTPYPSGTEGENGWYTSSVTMNLTAIDTGYGVENTTYRVNGSSWTLYTTPFPISTEGTNTVEYYSVDKAHNKETTKTLDIKIDKTQPTGQVTINNDDEYATSEGVMLYAVAEDGVGSGLYQMRFRNQGDSWNESWIAYTTDATPWTLKTGDGNKRVYVQFKDNAGNISPQTYDEIILDTEPPTTTSSISGDEGDDGWYTSNVGIELTVADTGSGVDYTSYRINLASWNNYTMPLTVGTEGTNTIEYYSVDKANNKETTGTLSIKIDKTRPTGGITINSGDIYTSSTAVELALTYADTVSGVDKVRFGNDAVLDTVPWEDPAATKQFTLRPGEGTKTVYYQIKDKAGNISPLESDDIILDTDPPLAAIEINEGDEYTNSTSVTLYLQYSDNLGVSEVRYRNYGSAYTEWEQPTDTKEWVLLTGDGSKTVYAQFKDQAGLISEISDSIILDTIPPTGSIKINNGDLTTTITTVTVTPTADDANGVAQMRLKNEGEDWNDWEEVATKTWTLTSGYGTKTVFAQFKDIAGSVSPTYNATIELMETVSPTPTPSPGSTPSERGSVIIYVKYENNDIAFGATVTSITQPTGQSPLVGTTDSQGAVTFSNIIVGSYSFHASKGGFGSANVQVTVQSQQTATINITLIQDLIKPTITVTITPENSGASQRIFTITAEDDIQGSGIASITLYIDDNPVKTWTMAGTHVYDEGVFSNGTHTYYVVAIDNAGNTVRNPASGYLEFLVEENANSEEVETWKILGVVLVLANGAALVLLAMKRKK